MRDCSRTCASCFCQRPMFCFMLFQLLYFPKAKYRKSQRNDNGSYKNHGSKYTLIQWKDCEVGRSKVLPRNKAVLDMKLNSTEYIIQKTWFTNKEAIDFTRRIYKVYGQNGCLPTQLVQYVFTGKEHSFKVPPHKNSNNNQRGFSRTKPSTVNIIKEKVKSCAGPSKIYDVFETVGGMFDFESESSLQMKVVNIT